MKWTYVMSQKIKASLVLTTLLGAIALIAVLEQRNASALNRSFASIYYDRLIPATDIFYLTENLFQKRLLMEAWQANSNFSVSELRTRLAPLNANMDNRLKEFEQTYLITQELYYLAQLKQHLQHYAVVEKEILALAEVSESEAAAMYEAKGKADLHTTIHYLNELAQIQTNVGKELIQDAQMLRANTEVLSQVQIALAIVLGIIVLALLLASRLPLAQQPFHLN